jgi:hypothetical protein
LEVWLPSCTLTRLKFLANDGEFDDLIRVLNRLDAIPREGEREKERKRNQWYLYSQRETTGTTIRKW